VTSASHNHHEAQAAHSPCYFRCGRRASVVTGSRNVCSACYTRVRNAVANRPGARPEERRD
jgi:hypothetical protein